MCMYVYIYIYIILDYYIIPGGVCVASVWCVHQRLFCHSHCSGLMILLTFSEGESPVRGAQFDVTEWLASSKPPVCYTIGWPIYPSSGDWFMNTSWRIIIGSHNEWFIMDNPTKMEENWGYPYDLGNLHIVIPSHRWKRLDPYKMGPPS